MTTENINNRVSSDNTFEMDAAGPAGVSIWQQRCGGCGWTAGWVARWWWRLAWTWVLNPADLLVSQGQMGHPFNSLTIFWWYGISDEWNLIVLMALKVVMVVLVVIEQEEEDARKRGNRGDERQPTSSKQFVTPSRVAWQGFRKWLSNAPAHPSQWLAMKPALFDAYTALLDANGRPVKSRQFGKADGVFSWVVWPRDGQL